MKSISLVRWLAASWLVLLVVGYSSLKMPTALGARNFVSSYRAVFTTVNVATQTGFALEYAKPDDFAKPVQWIFALQTISGTLLSVVGGGVLLARVLKLRQSDGRIAAAGLILIGGAMLLGVLNWHEHDSFQRAAFRGLAAMSCSGLIFGAMPAVDSLRFVLVLAPLSVVGSFGAVVLLEIADALASRRKLNEHVRRVIELGGSLYVVGLLLLAGLFAIEGGSMRSAVQQASALVFSARGYGLPFEFANQWPRGVVWSTMALMLVGAGTAGATGSLGLGWLVTVPSTCWRTLHRALFCQGAMLLGALLLLFQTEPQLAAEHLILLVVSASMNVGISHEPVSIDQWGLIILSLLMVAGKALPLLFLRWLLCEKPQAI